MTPVRHQCLQLQKNFENFLFFSGFPRATENPSLSIIKEPTGRSVTFGALVRLNIHSPQMVVFNYFQ